MGSIRVLCTTCCGSTDVNPISSGFGDLKSRLYSSIFPLDAGSRSFTTSAAVSTRRAAGRDTRVGKGEGASSGRPSEKPQDMQRRISPSALTTVRSISAQRGHTAPAINLSLFRGVSTAARFLIKHLVVSVRTHPSHGLLTTDLTNYENSLLSRGG